MSGIGPVVEWQVLGCEWRKAAVRSAIWQWQQATQRRSFTSAALSVRSWQKLPFARAEVVIQQSALDKRSSDEIAVNGTLVAGHELGSLAADDVWIRGLRRVGRQGGFSMAREVDAEGQYDEVALNARVSLCVGF